MKTMRVKDKYRKNPLSFQPGGYEVTVEFSDGFQKTYDKVKYPKQFIKHISNNENPSKKIVAVYVDGLKVRFDI